MPSSVIAASHYDPVKQILKIVYVSGMVYDYIGVPEKIYAEMKVARSKGRFLNMRIKNKYPFVKVENDMPL